MDYGAAIRERRLPLVRRGDEFARLRSSLEEYLQTDDVGLAACSGTADTAGAEVAAQPALLPRTSVPVSRMGESAHRPDLESQSMSGIELSAPSPGGRTSSSVSRGHRCPSIRTHAVRIDMTMDQQALG
jgi:hypothetical protein